MCMFFGWLDTVSLSVCVCAHLVCVTRNSIHPCRRGCLTLIFILIFFKSLQPPLEMEWWLFLCFQHHWRLYFVLLAPLEDGNTVLHYQSSKLTILYVSFFFFLGYSLNSPLVCLLRFRGLKALMLTSFGTNATGGI
jgi:hypothetical protein